MVGGESGGESVDKQLVTLRADLEQLMREFYGSPQTPGISGQLNSLRKEITSDQLTLRRELTEKQDSIRSDFFEKQEELRRELTKRQDDMKTELSNGQTAMREEFVAASSEMRGSIKATLWLLGVLGAFFLAIPAIGTFVLAVLDHTKK